MRPMVITPNISFAQKLKPRGEDRITSELLTNGILFVGIYDGHNGPNAATWCAKNMHKIISENYVNGKSTISVLRAAFLQAHGSIADQSGTTASVILIKDRYIAVAHVGDSRVVLCHAGKAVTITEDHHTNWQSEHDRLTSAEVRLKRTLICCNRVDGLMLTRSIGDRLLSSEIIPHPIINEFLRTDEDEFMIVATDGLWDVCSGSTAVSIVRAQKLTTADEIADALIYYANQQYNSRNVHADDITCCVIDFKSSLKRTSASHQSVFDPPQM